MSFFSSSTPSTPPKPPSTPVATARKARTTPISSARKARTTTISSRRKAKKASFAPQTPNEPALNESQIQGIVALNEGNAKIVEGYNKIVNNVIAANAAIVESYNKTVSKVIASNKKLTADSIAIAEMSLEQLNCAEETLIRATVVKMSRAAHAKVFEELHDALENVVKEKEDSKPVAKTEDEEATRSNRKLHGQLKVLAETSRLLIEENQKMKARLALAEEKKSAMEDFGFQRFVSPKQQEESNMIFGKARTMPIALARKAKKASSTPQTLNRLVLVESQVQAIIALNQFKVKIVEGHNETVNKVITANEKLNASIIAVNDNMDYRILPAAIASNNVAIASNDRNEQAAVASNNPAIALNGESLELSKAAVAGSFALAEKVFKEVKRTVEVLLGATIARSPRTPRYKKTTEFKNANADVAEEGKGVENSKNDPVTFVKFGTSKALGTTQVANFEKRSVVTIGEGKFIVMDNPSKHSVRVIPQGTKPVFLKQGVVDKNEEEEQEEEDVDPSGVQGTHSSLQHKTAATPKTKSFLKTTVVAQFVEMHTKADKTASKRAADADTPSTLSRSKRIRAAEN